MLLRGNKSLHGVESIRLFEEWLRCRVDLADARADVRIAEQTGEVTVEQKDAVVLAERAVAAAERAHDAIAKTKARAILRIAV